MKIPTVQDMSKFDKMVYDLATYDISKGLIITSTTPERVYEVNQKIFDQFNYFKMLIRTNECNLGFLQYTIFRKYSALTDKEFVSKYGEYKEDINKCYLEDEEDRELNRLMAYILSNPVYKNMLLSPAETEIDKKSEQGKKSKKLREKNQENPENPKV